MATATRALPPLRLVFSYAREDEDLRDLLAAHLSPLERAGIVACWHDREIPAGTRWRSEIDRALAAADVVLLLISPWFVQSDYCFTVEMTRALERHAEGRALVIPVLLRPVVPQGQPWAELQGVPRDLRAISLWPNQDEALASVIREILEALESWRERVRAVEAPPETAEPLIEDRVLDAAIASRVRVGEASEVLAQVRLPESGGLRALLRVDESFAPEPDSVRSRPFHAEFPRGRHAEPLPLTLTLVLDAPDFTPPSQTKRIKVPPASDSVPYVFLASPRRAGRLALRVELVGDGDVSVASALLRTDVGATILAGPALYGVVSLPLMTVSYGASTVELPTTSRQTLPAPAPAATPVEKPSATQITGSFPVGDLRPSPGRSTPRASPGPRRSATWVGSSVAAVAASLFLGVIVHQLRTASPPELVTLPTPAAEPSGPTPITGPRPTPTPVPRLTPRPWPTAAASPVPRPIPPPATPGLVPTPAPAPTTRPIRVGGRVEEPKKVRHVPPVYPEAARRARAQGVVILDCTISPEGTVSDVKVLRGVPLLNEAAIAAVEQWVYEPTILDGVAVPVITTVTVNFRR